MGHDARRAQGFSRAVAGRGQVSCQYWLEYEASNQHQVYSDHSTSAGPVRRTCMGRRFGSTRGWTSRCPNLGEQLKTRCTKIMQCSMEWCIFITTTCLPYCKNRPEGSGLILLLPRLPGFFNQSGFPLCQRSFISSACPVK